MCTFAVWRIVEKYQKDKSKTSVELITYFHRNKSSCCIINSGNISQEKRITLSPIQPHFALTKEMHAVSEKYCGRCMEQLTGHYNKFVSKTNVLPEPRRKYKCKITCMRVFTT